MDRKCALKGVWHSTRCPRVLRRVRETGKGTGRGDAQNGSWGMQEKNGGGANQDDDNSAET